VTFAWSVLTRPEVSERRIQCPPLRQMAHFCFAREAALPPSRSSSVRLLPPGGLSRLLAHEIEAVLEDILLLGVVDGQLARDAIEIIGTPGHHEVVRP
jgi:hypothetical protein